MTTPTAPMEEDEDRAVALGSAVPSLLPCPHCGGRVALTPDSAGEATRYSVMCKNLGCRAGQYGFADENRAAECWNRRAPSPVSGGEEGGLLADIEASKARAMASADGKIILSSQTYYDLLDLAALSKREKIEDRKSDDLLEEARGMLDQSRSALKRICRLNQRVTDGSKRADINAIAVSVIHVLEAEVSARSQPTEASGSLKDDPDIARMMKGDLR